MVHIKKKEIKKEQIKFKHSFNTIKIEIYLNISV